MRNLFLAIILFLSVPVMAQKSLLFYHTGKNKTIEIKQGIRVSLLYKGYMGQVEFSKEIIREITDSTITLGLDYTEMLPGLRPGRMNLFTHKVIRTEDILGFRKMGVGRQLAKTGVALGGAVGSFYLLRSVFNSNNISTANSFLLSLGIGTGLYAMNELLFPENIKYYMEDGWKVKVIDSGR
jgi:hypothetical protein